MKLRQQLYKPKVAETSGKEQERDGTVMAGHCRNQHDDSYGADAAANFDYDDGDGDARCSSRSLLLPQRLASSMGSRLEGWWRSYKRTVQDPSSRAVIMLGDEMISRLLWVASPYSHRHHQWREMMWGLLQLHRLVMDLADDEYRMSVNSYGTTLSVDNPDVPTNSLRIGVSVVHCLWPVCQELASVVGGGSGDNDAVTLRRQSRVRLFLERVRFCLRVVLMVSYWRKVGPKLVGTSVMPGILQAGGLFHGAHPAPGVRQERSRLDRIEYVGRRTGRRVISTGRMRQQEQEQAATHGSGENQNPTRHASSLAAVSRTVVGELLYLFRPLFWAQAEANHYVRRAETGGDPRRDPYMGELWKSWLLSLGMDVASLVTLSQDRQWLTSSMSPAISTNANDSRNAKRSKPNQLTREEWMRRRMRLLLYLLRSPFWDSYTSVALNRVGNAVQMIPLVGALLDSYLQDWLYYWKVYRAEEG